MITQTLCSVFKLNVLKGLEDFDPSSSYVYKIALYTENANLGADTLVYTTDHETVGSGYVAGGKTLTKVAPTLDGRTACVTFENVTWNPAEFSAKAALIYNSTTQAAVAVLDFGENKTTQTAFTITFPTQNAANAVIRFS